MKPTTKIAILFASIWIILKLSLYLGGIAIESLSYTILSNVLFLIVVVFLGQQFTIKSLGKKYEDDFFTDFKIGMRGSLVYSVIISAFIFLYYSSIDRDFLEEKRSESRTAIETSLKEHGGFEAVQDFSDGWDGKNENDYLEEKFDEVNLIYSPKTQTTLSLFMLLMVSVLYSILVTAFRRLLVSKFTN